jgi:hypothetical protein
MKKRRSSKGLGAVTKGDFKAIAEILCGNAASRKLTHELSRYFISQNPRFDAKRFQRAATTCKFSDIGPRDGR